MRVLMLGQDFSPRRSGGVGSACQGLATALARARERRVEVLFVLPREEGDEEPGDVRLLIGDGRWRPPQVEPESAPSAATPAPAPPAAPLAAAPETPDDVGATDVEPARATDPAAPSLPAPAEALRLLAIASPLRPYLGPDDYASHVRALLERLRPEPTVAPEPPARTRPAPARVRRAATGPARLAARAAPTLRAAPAVPPYARTLGAEVERYAREVLALVQAEDFDVIHAHDWMTFPAALLVAEQRKKPLVVHFHSCESERRGAHASEEVRKIEQAAIDAATRVLAVSRKSAATLEHEYALQPAKLRVLHNAFAPLPQVRAVPSEHKTVLYTGRLSLQKGPDLFLAAAARVHAHLSGTRFVLAGEGELYPELVKLARKLGIGDVVRFAGFLDGQGLAEAFADAAAFVMPSRAEPFGIGALEALALGVPTLVADDAGVNEVVRSVLRFDPENAEELADKLVAVLTHPALAAELRRSGLRETRRLRWDRPARTLAALYDEVVT